MQGPAEKNLRGTVWVLNNYGTFSTPKRFVTRIHARGCIPDQTVITCGEQKRVTLNRNLGITFTEIPAHDDTADIPEVLAGEIRRGLYPATKRNLHGPGDLPEKQEGEMSVLR